MFIKDIIIKNFRRFREQGLSVNVPDLNNEGSGLTVIVGENGCGKTSLLDAISLPLLSYKAENLSIEDFHNPEEDVLVKLIANDNFTVKPVIGNNDFQSKGLSFQGRLRQRERRLYLSSSIVQEQLFLRANGHTDPPDGHANLRVSVNHPFAGKRFDENDIVFLDKNRTYQIRTGTYNSTRFDRITEDLNHQYTKNSMPEVNNLNENILTAWENVQNDFLNKAREHFREISGTDIDLYFINNWQPFSKSFFAHKKDNNQLIPIHMIGSGYEMVFSLLYSFYLAEKSEKQLIILIDEPELHLHPSLQKDFVKILLEFSKTSQIIATSHSPLLVKQLSSNEKTVKVLKLMNGSTTIEPTEKRVLPYVSYNETNYLAFDLYTEEYHNELYGRIQEKEEKFSLNEIEDYLVAKSIRKDKTWTREKDGIPEDPKQVTLQTFIRNKIHHPENVTMQGEQYSDEELERSIDQMREILNGSH